MIHLWYAFLSSGSTRKDERDLARALSRRLLSSLTRVPEKELRIVPDPAGRPEIREPVAAREFQFNLSHTRELVACGATAGRRIGVDAERVRHDESLLHVAEARFTAAENRWLRGLPGMDRFRGFLQLWTLKEAYAKARGLSAASVLDRASFELEDGRIGARFSPDLKDDPSDWLFHFHDIGARHVLATAVTQGTAPHSVADYCLTLVKDLASPSPAAIVEHLPGI